MTFIQQRDVEVIWPYVSVERAGQNQNRGFTYESDLEGTSGRAFGFWGRRLVWSPGMQKASDLRAKPTLDGFETIYSCLEFRYRRVHSRLPAQLELTQCALSAPRVVSGNARRITAEQL